MNPLRIFLVVALVLVVFGVGNASAIDEKEPKRTYPVDSYVSSLDISTDGKYIVAGSCYGEWGNTGSSATIKLFKNGIIPTSSPDKEVDLPESNGCPAVAMSDGLYLSYTFAHGTPRLQTHSAGMIGGGGTENVVDWGTVICRMAISDNGKRVITVSSCEESAVVRSYTEGNNGWSFEGPMYSIGGPLRHLSMSANGGYAVVGSNNGLHLLDFEEGNRWTYGEESLVVVGVDISQNGEYIIADTWDNSTENTILLYKKTVLWSLNETEGSSSQVQISNDGNYILIGNSLFNKDSPTPLRSFDDEVQLSEGNILLSNNGENILARGSDGNLYFFDRDSSSPLWSIKQDWIGHFAISSDGKHVAVVIKLGDDYYVYFYEEGLNFTYLFGAGVLIFIVAGVVISRRVRQAG